MRRSIILSLIVTCLSPLLLTGCILEEAEPLTPPLLPPGFEDSKVPDINLDGYLYIAQENPILVGEEFSLPFEANVEQASGCLSPTGSREASWAKIVFSSSDDAQAAYQAIPESQDSWKFCQGSDLFFVYGQGSGAQSLIRATTQDDFILFRHAYRSIYKMMDRLPTNPPGNPVGAGFLRPGDNFENWLRGDYGEATDLEFALLDLTDTLEKAKIGEIVIGAYSEKDLNMVNWEELQESGLSALLIGKSSYPGLVISQVLPRTGLTEESIEDEKIYVATFDSAHVATKSVGSYIYISIAPKLEEAKYLLRTALAKLGLVSLPEELEKPSEFWAEVSKTDGLGLRIRQNPGTEAKILKVVPDDWVLYVANTHRDTEIYDGYTWWEVKDVTDGTEGWAASRFLRYEESKQDEWKQRTKKVPFLHDVSDDSKFVRDLSYGMGGEGDLAHRDHVAYLQMILKEEIGPPTYPENVRATGYFGDVTKSAVIKFQEKYKDEVLTPLELERGTGYVGSRTRAKLNELLEDKEFKAKLEDEYELKKGRISVTREAVEQFLDENGFPPVSFPTELILAMAAQESGFDNEVNRDGLMQVTEASGCHRDGLYSNTRQGIYANVEDGLKVLKWAYDYSHGDVVGSVWRYNGGEDPYSTYQKGKGDPHYLEHVAEKYVEYGFGDKNSKWYKLLMEAQEKINSDVFTGGR